MSHRCGRSSPERSDLYKEQSKAADGKCFCFNTQSGNSKYFNQHKDKQHKIRRLKTRKERYQKAGKDLTFFPNCCQCRHRPTRKKTPISSAPLVTQEPSIITDSRLTGHHGLFNHEVKSIDIERLLRKNCTLQREQNTEEVKDYSSNLSPTTCSPVLLSSDGLLGANVEGCMASKRNATTKTHDDSQGIETINLQSSNKETDVTPGVLQLYSSIQHFFPYQDRHLAAMQQDRHLADTQLFPQEQNESETDRFYSAPVYQSKSHSCPQNNLLQTFGQLSPFHPNFRSNPADMMDYPPSHMLEKSLAPRSSSLHSPEHWSFPPMRLY
uniref:Uncharacterized protein n=1 Tax=Cyprinodon variegatus TaxID=28743 RepID=A0A3Q2DWA0_CYPVA